MIDLLQSERASKEHVKSLVLPEIPRETALLYGLGSHHALQVVLQSGTEEPGRQHLGLGQRAVLKQDRRTLEQMDRQKLGT